MPKKKKPNKGGRPRDGKNLKVHKSVRLDPDLIKLVEDEFPNFNKGIELLILNFKSNAKDMEF